MTVLNSRDSDSSENQRSTLRKLGEAASQAREEVSAHQVNEVVGHVERSTIKPESSFEEENPHVVLENGLLNLKALELEFIR